MEREKIIYFLSFFCRHTPFHRIWRQFYFIFILAEIMHNKTVIRGALETLVRKKKSRRQETFRQISKKERIESEDFCRISVRAAVLLGRHLVLNAISDDAIWRNYESSNLKNKY
jgi:hypothetical protein